MKKLFLALAACAASALCGCAVGYPVVGRTCAQDGKGQGPWLPVDGKITERKVVVDGKRCVHVDYKNGHIFCETKDGGPTVEVEYSSMRMADTSKMFWATNLNNN